jgi:REP element-mobilizing transposase RayT
LNVGTASGSVARMARPLRIQFPGGIYHVTARGNGRQALFVDDIDCARFLGVLQAVVAEYRLLCHAYCLMTNHYHLLLETPEANLSRAMQQLNGVFAQRFNRRHERTGHVLEGRFHAQVIDRDAHLREVCRYIVLNPVRAGLVADPREWRWSSFQATAGETEAPLFLTVDWVLSLAGARSRAEAERSYLLFVQAGIGAADSDMDPARAVILSPAGQIPDVRTSIERAATLTKIRRDQRFPVRPSLEDLFRDMTSRADRDARCMLAVRDHGYTLSAVARFVGLHYSRLSHILASNPSRPDTSASPQRHTRRRAQRKI